MVNKAQAAEEGLGSLECYALKLEGQLPAEGLGLEKASSGIGVPKASLPGYLVQIFYLHDLSL